MQRMATELHGALQSHPVVELSGLLLRTSWRFTGLRMGPFGIRLLRQIPRVVESRGIEVVLFSSMVTGALSPVLRERVKRAGAVLASIVVGRDVTLPVRPYQQWVPRALEALDLVLPISRAAEEACRARGLGQDRLQVVPCGIDTDRLAAPADRSVARQFLQDTLGDPAQPLPSDALLLCGVGRHVERKGFHWFVDQVMPLLPGNVHFWLAGEGPMTPAVRDAIGARGLQDRVRLLGRVSDEALGKLYRGADLFMMPNIPVAGDIEGFGIVMLEAGLCGLPTIAGRVDGIPDVIREGQNGRLVPSGDAGAFARAVLHYAEHRSDLAALSARAPRYVTHTFGWSAVSNQYVELFRKLSPTA